MLGLHTTGFLDQNLITLSKEILVQKFTSATPQVQLSFVQAIQRAKYVTPILEFPIKAYTCPTIVQQILSMYTWVFVLYHDQTFSEALVGLLMYLSEAVKFDYPKLIVYTMCEQLSNFNTLTYF